MKRQVSLSGPLDGDSECEAAPQMAAQQPLSTSPKYRYADLSRSGAEVLIEYQGQIYRLRTTRNGKLIMIK